MEDESDPTVDAYLPDFEPSDDECGYPEDRVSFLRFAPSYQRGEDAPDKSESQLPRMMVVRCALTQQEYEDWCRTAIFHTYVKCNDEFQGR